MRIAIPPWLRSNIKLRKRVAEPILNRYAEDDPRAAAAAEAVGKQVRRERREDVLNGAVLVDVAGHPEGREIAHFVGVGDGAAEDQNRQPPFVQRPERPDQIDAGRGRQAQSSTMRSIAATSSRTRASSSAPLFTATALWPALSSAAQKRSRTNAVSSAMMMVFDGDGGFGHLKTIGTRQPNP